MTRNGHIPGWVKPPLRNPLGLVTGRQATGIPFEAVLLVHRKAECVRAAASLGVEMGEMGGPREGKGEGEKTGRDWIIVFLQK